MIRLMITGAGLFATLAVTTSASAQWVRVGPLGGVRVRAPFVAVDVLPYGGGARVRAPFTAVDTRAYASPYYGPPVYYDGVPLPPGYGVPVVPAPPVYPVPPAYAVPPSTYQSARPVLPQGDALVSQLRASTIQLRQSLSLRRRDAGVWINYLGLDRILQTLDGAADPASLRSLVMNFDGIIGNPSLGSIRYAPGFASTHQLLRAYVDSVPVRAPAETLREVPQSDPPQTQDVPEPAPTDI